MSDLFSVLVVDDNLSLAKAMADILDFKGFEVHTANCGKEALEFLKYQTVDVMLTDVKMPDMNGVELYRETRQTHPRMTTFLMTAYAANEIIQQGMAEGIQTVFTKPVDIDLLLTFLETIRRVNKKPG